jgi:LAO/AO transport system ATPase
MLARALTVLENDGPQAQALYAEIGIPAQPCPVVGFTGAPGVGKSTLIDSYVAELRGRGAVVGVLAVDPSSPRSGGAVLGDRARMLRHATDSGVYVRSFAARGHLGGLTRAFARVLDLLQIAAFDLLIIETVGTGQSEVQLADVATTNVVVCAPGMGDELQAIKAGVLEIADIAVVNKGDQLAAGPTVLVLEDALNRSEHDPRWRIPVLETIAIDGTGVAALADQIERHGIEVGLARAGQRSIRERLETRVIELARARLRAYDNTALAQLQAAVASGALSEQDAARQVLDTAPPS